jgi:hypothetical protein
MTESYLKKLIELVDELDRLAESLDWALSDDVVLLKEKMSFLRGYLSALEKDE